MNLIKFCGSFKVSPDFSTYQNFHLQWIKNFQEAKKNTPKFTPKCFKKYLKENHPLDFWAKSAAISSKLFKIAQKTFCVSPTSVPAESLFSTLSYIFDDRRQNLAPSCLDALIKVSLDTRWHQSLEAKRNPKDQSFKRLRKFLF